MLQVNAKLEELMPVAAFWDIGVGDTTAVVVMLQGDTGHGVIKVVDSSDVTPEEVQERLKCWK
jgi:hypothetical protein